MTVLLIVVDVSLEGLKKYGKETRGNEIKIKNQDYSDHSAVEINKDT